VDLGHFSAASARHASLAAPPGDSKKEKEKEKEKERKNP
jgi:hypothetical protein